MPATSTETAHIFSRPRPLLRLCCAVAFACLAACTGAPEGVTPVQGFELNRYLGTWYEIARLDHSFERGLQQVSARYSLHDDGGVEVVNRGYSEGEGWQEATGKAYFVGDRDSAHLKVSFFGPFYGSYIVFELERENYQYAFIAGNTTSYLWLLARSPTVNPAVKERFVERAASLGFATEQLIFVDQDKSATTGQDEPL